MNIQPVSTINTSFNQLKNPSFQKYRDISKEILNSDIHKLINIAEFFHNAPEEEVQQITKSSKKAYEVIKGLIDAVQTRKNCYIADGSNFCKQRAEELDKKAASRNLYFFG